MRPSSSTKSINRALIGVVTTIAVLGLSACSGGSSGTTAVEPTVVAPVAPVLSLKPQNVKSFAFSWSDVSGETEYRLLENPDGVAGYTKVATLTADSTSHAQEVFLPARINARYMLQACNSAGCTSSAAVFVSGSLAEAVGYVKASNTDIEDFFGFSVALSGDGNTLAVGAFAEDSSATGIDGEQADNTAGASGAVYVFSRSFTGWSQQAYLKASNAETTDMFGSRIALSGDGNTLAVSATGEGSNAIGIGGDQANNVASNSGAVYVFTRNGTAWSQQAYVKASNTAAFDNFGSSLALSGDGNTLAVGAYGEDSSATGIDGDQADNAAGLSGAVYVFSRSGTAWSQQAYVKASNTGAGDTFGSVALSGDGNTLAVGAYQEDSNATVIGGDQVNNAAANSGAVYLFSRSGTAWSQQAYVKASNTEANDWFGINVALAADGNTLAVGAYGEDGNAIGIDGDQVNNAAANSGAVYLFSRSGTAWSQQAYVKASNTEANDYFGINVALSADGNTLAVGAYGEDGNAIGIDGDQTNNLAITSGAVYLFSRSGTAWDQQAYVKASNTEAVDYFGSSVALSADGNTLAVGAYGEHSNATGIGGDQADNSAITSGAVYLY